MITRVAIEPDALVTLGAGLPTPLAKVSHESLLRTLRAHGTIVFSSDTEASAFVDAIRSETFPAWARQKWIELLTEFLKARPKRAAAFRPASPLPLAQVGLEQLTTMWAPHADVAVLSDPRSAAFGIPRDDGHCRVLDSDFELSTAAAAPLCDHFVRIQTLIDKGVVPCGDARDDFFRDVLAPLAHESTGCTIVDKYLFSSLWRFRGRRRNAEHVAWLLKGLDAHLRPGSSVNLIANTDGCETAGSTLDLLQSVWLRGTISNISELQATLLPQGSTILPHDRHIRFNMGSAVIIDAGFDRLSDPTISDQDGMRWQYKWSSQTLQLLQRAERRCTESPYADRATASRF